MPSHKIYYYVHTGHRIGLDRFRRAAAIINALEGVDITLLCSDFRIAQIARDFGVDKSVGIDVVRNIPQIAHHGDKIIFDSDEANPIMLDDMRKYFSTFIRVSDDKDDSREEGEFLISPYLDDDSTCKAYAIDDKYFKMNSEAREGNLGNKKEQKSIKLSYFFGDDDYEKDLEKNLSFLDGLEPDLQLGFYYFLDYEDMLKEKFDNYHEFEDYNEMIKKSEILITASAQAVLESLASGGKPIYFQRADYTYDFQKLFKNLNVPIVENYDKHHLNEILQTIGKRKYAEITHSSNKISKFIKESLNL